MAIKKVNIKCHNCGYEWNYKGDLENNYYCSCPHCMYKVNIKKNSLKTKNDKE